MIKINCVALRTSKPTNLDDLLIASTGCSSSEVEKLLGGGPDLAARALRPFLEPDMLPGGELAAAIANDGDAIPQILKVFTAAAPAITEEKNDG